MLKRIPPRFLQKITAHLHGEILVLLEEDEVQRLLEFLARQTYFTWDLQVEGSGKRQMQEILGRIFQMAFLEDLLVQ